MRYSIQLVFLLIGLKIVASRYSDDDRVYFPGYKSSSDASNKETNLLPDDCGLGVTSRITNGEDAQLGEFPWMAALQYQFRNEKIDIDCGGALINDRYVLTAAHCVRVSGKKLHAVRLREYNTATIKDCVGHVCSDPPAIHTIEEEIVHEKFIPGSHDQHYDIALLRLKNPVNPSKFAKPICLPESHSLTGEFIAAGWGLAGTAEKGRDVLQKVTLPLADRRRCEDWYGALTNPARIIENQICVGGVNGKDTCKGDSGGPLIQMDYSRSRYEVVGITSFGSAFCGEEGVPSVYTKVFNFVPWIKSKLRP